MPGRPRTRQVRRLRHHRVAHAAHVERRPHMCRSSGMPGPDGGARYSRVDAITQRAPVNRPAGRERRRAPRYRGPRRGLAGAATFIRLYVAVAAGLAGRRRRRGQGRVPAADASAGRWPPVAAAAGHARRRPSPPRAPGPGLVPGPAAQVRVEPLQGIQEGIPARARAGTAPGGQRPAVTDSGYPAATPCDRPETRSRLTSKAPILAHKMCFAGQRERSDIVLDAVRSKHHVLELVTRIRAAVQSRSRILLHASTERIDAGGGTSSGPGAARRSAHPRRVPGHGCQGWPIRTAPPPARRSCRPQLAATQQTSDAATRTSWTDTSRQAEGLRAPAPAGPWVRTEPWHGDASPRRARRSLAARQCRPRPQTTTGVVDCTVVVADSATIGSSSALPDRRLEHRPHLPRSTGHALSLPFNPSGSREKPWPRLSGGSCRRRSGLPGGGSLSRAAARGRACRVSVRRPGR